MKHPRGYGCFLLKRVRGAAALLTALCLLISLLPVSASGEEPVRQVDVTYRVDRSTPTMHYRLSFDDRVFLGDPGVYDHTLCRMSLGMALAAFRPSFLEEDQSANIRTFFEQAGFENLRIDQYGQFTDDSTVGSVIASRAVGSGEESFTLVAVAVCGGNYSNEWLSNLKVGDPGDKTEIRFHQGFYEAACRVHSRVREYLSDIGGRTRVWIAGYSRGAAVSNLTAALMVQEGTAAPGDVFAYTFATPATTLDENAASPDYRGFYSITGMFDLVPRVPLSSWGFTRYGTTLTLPSMESDTGYGAFFDRACSWSEENLDTPFFRSTFVNYTLEKILDALAALFPTPRDYVEKMQLRAMEIWREMANVPAMIRLLGDIYSETSEDRNIVFLDYLLAEDAWQGLVQWSGLGDLDLSGSHSLMENLSREHFPDAYLSLIMSCGEELYDADRGFVRITLCGNARLTVTEVTELEQRYERELPSMTVTARGVAPENDIRGVPSVMQPWPFLVLSGGSVLTLPAGGKYLLYLNTVNSEEDSVIFRFCLGGGARSVEKSASLDSSADNAWFAMLDLTDPDGPDGDIVFYSGGNSVAYTGDTAPILQAGLMDIVYITGTTASDNLRTVALTVGSIVTALAVTLLLAVVWAAGGRLRRAAAVLVDLLFINYVLIQLSTNFLPAWGGFRSVFKGLATTTVLMLCLMCALQNRSRRNVLMLCGFILYIVNDVMIDFRLLAGLVASMLGNCLFIAAFFCGGRRRFRFPVFFACLLPSLALLILFRDASGVQGYFAELSVCAAVLSVMTAASFEQGRLIRIGSILLMLTAAAVFFTLVAGNRWWTYVVSLALYYAGMVTLALGTLDGVRLPALSARGRRKREERLRRRGKKAPEGKEDAGETAGE